MSAESLPKSIEQLIDKSSIDALNRFLINFTKNCEADAIQAFINSGANVNFQDAQGMTALHHAAARGARACIRVLVNSGQCDYLIKDNEDRYAFEIAIEWAKDYAVGRLLAKKQKQQAVRQGVPAWVKLKKR